MIHKTQVNLVELYKAVKALSYKRDSTGVLMACGQGQGTKLGNEADIIRITAQEIAHYRKTRPLHIMCNIIPPGVSVPEHIDYIPNQRHVERWHLPIKTNEKAIIWEEETGEYYMSPRYWWGPVTYWKMHSVRNLGDEERIHLVVDLDKDI
jgi:hypothetical protein